MLQILPDDHADHIRSVEIAQLDLAAGGLYVTRLQRAGQTWSTFLEGLRLAGLSSFCSRRWPA